MKRIIHFANDEKFIDKAYDEFKQFESLAHSHFTIFSNNSQLKHIRFKCSIADENYFKHPETAVILNSYDLIIIHFMDVRYFDLLKNQRIKTKILWIGWGGDYYWLINTLNNFAIYKELTKAQLGIKDNFFLKILKKYKNNKNVNLLNRVNYFSPVLEEDFSLIKKNYKNFKPQYVAWNYGNLEDHYRSDLPILGDAVLLGNSATATNNHYDLIKIIDQLNLSNEKIFIPVSYGEKGYKDRLKKNLLKREINVKNIILLEDFLTVDEYNNILSQCSNVFMGHIRQQAMGNVISLIYMGARLFFFRESVVYNYLIKNGLAVYSFDQLLDNRQLLHETVDAETHLRNREILKALWGKQINRENTERIIILA